MMKSFKGKVVLSLMGILAIGLFVGIWNWQVIGFKQIVRLPDTVNVPNLPSDFHKQAVSKEWTSRDLTLPDYLGPVVQIAICNENGDILHYDSLNLQVIDDNSSTGGFIAFENADSIKFPLVDGPGDIPSMRAGITYRAWNTTFVNGEVLVEKAEFIIPKSALQSKLYKLPLIMKKSHDKLANKPLVKANSYSLEGTVPVIQDKSIVPFRILYQHPNGKKILFDDLIPSGGHFKLGVDSLGGDFVVFDSDIRSAYGVITEVKNEKIGAIKALQGHREYKLTRLKQNPPEFVEFFPLDQTRVSLFTGVFPPNSNETKAMIVPGTYQVRIYPADAKDRSAYSLKNVAVGDDSVIEMKP